MSPIYYIYGAFDGIKQHKALTFLKGQLIKKGLTPTHAARTGDNGG